MTDWGDLGAQTNWDAESGLVGYGSMAELFADQWDINKLAHYIPVYESTFAPYRDVHDVDRELAMLEIGVSFGGSLELWRKYFGADTRIVGIDSNPKCMQFNCSDRNVFVRTGSQQDPEFLQSVINEFGPFDIILDDGSHLPANTLASFRHLFAHGLNDGGAYLVEDLHTCYSVDCYDDVVGTLARTPQFTEIIKELIDAMHAVYLQTPTGDEFADAFELNNPLRRNTFQVPLLTKLISSIEVYDSIAVIRRGPRKLPIEIRRWSRERMASVLSEGAARFLDEHPYIEC